MQILSDRGYLIPAVNTEKTDYVACAVRLAESIKQWHPHAEICLLTDKEYEHEIFDHVRLLPHGDLDKDSDWKLSNDWQCFTSSPFRRTIKLEADMLCASSIDHWWDLFEQRDLVISTGSRDFYDQPAESRYYRKIFDANNLPDVYNAITFWKLSGFAQDFFMVVRKIFNHWDLYKTLLKFPDDLPTTDVVYAIATTILGVDKCTLPPGFGPNIVHMKKNIIPIDCEDWTKQLVWEHTDPGLRIQTVAQWGLVHYHIKDWQ